MISVLFYRLASFLARCLPVPLAESITTFLAATQYAVRSRTRKTISGNLAIVLGSAANETELRQCTRRVVFNFARSIYCFLRLPYVSRRELLERCQSNGFTKTAGELRARGGFIVCGPHVGAWEVGGAYLTALGLELRTVSMEHGSKHVTRFFDQRREQVGVQVLPISGSLRSIPRALERGEVVALLIDRSYGCRREACRWFGTDVALPVGHAALAVRCGVPIVTAICVFDDNGGFQFIHRGPYHPDPSLPRYEAIRSLHDKCVRDMEDFIRDYPDQWFHFRPLGAASA